MRRSAAALLFFLSLAAVGSRAYRNDAMGVRMFEPPPGWERAPQSSYPRLLVSYSHAEGGKLTLSAQRVPAGTTAAALANEARAPLEKQGFTRLTFKPDGARVRVTAELDSGKRVAMQLYVVDAGFGYVLTLITPLATSDRMAQDFDAAARSLQLGGPLDAGASP
jgi:hypothetical protein